MLPIDLSAYRRQSDRALLSSVADREPLALAEILTRTLGPANAVAQRFLPSRELEPVIHQVYRDLWMSPPEDERPERWVRTQVSEHAIAMLEELDEPPRAPSIAEVVSGLETPGASNDPVEKRFAGLDQQPRLTLVRAHDLGLPAQEADLEDLVTALLAFAEAEGNDNAAANQTVMATPELANHVLGLNSPEDDEEIEASIATDRHQSAAAQLLRRGKRRLDGLPPAPDLSARLLASILGAGGVVRRPRRGSPAASSALDAPAPSWASARSAAPAPAAAPETQSASEPETPAAVAQQPAPAGGPDTVEADAGPDTGAMDMRDIFAEENANVGSAVADSDDDRFGQGWDDLSALQDEPAPRVEDEGIVASYTAGEDDIDEDDYGDAPRRRGFGILGWILLAVVGVALGLVLGQYILQFVLDLAPL